MRQSKMHLKVQKAKITAEREQVQERVKILEKQFKDVERAIPFIDIVQEALVRPEKRMMILRDWNEAKKDGGTAALVTERIKLEQSRVFKLSDDFVRVTAAASMLDPGVLLNSITCARLPYDAMWMEWNEEVRLKALSGLIGMDSAMRIGTFMQRIPGYDDRFIAEMFWIHRPDHPQINDIGGEGKVFMSLFSIIWSSGGPLEEGFGLRVEGLTAKTKEEIDPVFVRLVGRNYHETWTRHDASVAAKDRLHMNEVEAHLSIGSGAGWRANLGMDDILMKGTDEKSTARRVAILGDAIMAVEGDIRFILTALALLQTKWTTRVDHRAGGGVRDLPGVRTKWLDVHECVITAPKERIIRGYPMMVKTGALRRRHEVMGHWCHRVGTGLKDCVHEYKENDKGQEVCARCRDVRWWRKSHERGSLEVGKVSKTYRVEAP